MALDAASSVHLTVAGNKECNAHPSLRLSENGATPFKQATWGRASNRGSWLHSIISMVLLVVTPLIVVCSYITLAAYDGSLSKFVAAVHHHGFISILWLYSPKFSMKATVSYVLWITFQAILFVYLPGPVNTGQRTPAGNILTYKTNGLNAWIVTHSSWAIGCAAGWLDPGFIPRNWEGLVFAMNVAGILLAAFAYAKAYLMPTHPGDRKFSGSRFYDFFMGIELNPRLGDMFDFKLFTNGRPGIVAWSLIDISNIAYQYQTYGRVDLSIVLITILHTIYILEFFAKESWYLRTIDIAHDHFGFYLAWGSLALLPTMYTIQTQYLGRYPTSTPTAYQIMVFLAGISGYALLRSVNDQKDHVRRTRGKCNIWGKPAQYIVAAYKTIDGMQHESLLLCSGWWGWSRHANYLGDIILSTAMCALVGSGKLLVWFYAIFMTVLLVHRCIRDEERCSAKYGEVWEKYSRRVPWRILPGIW
ncbi:ergosterol biosynthesis ERG4/ERG24 family protein [Xylariales sp. PMI_506]|nr:ergosterol biosynthesis ERG4/ERG24 family protein [Xylariales sp. PMI_506]